MRVVASDDPVVDRGTGPLLRAIMQARHRPVRLNQTSSWHHNGRRRRRAYTVDENRKAADRTVIDEPMLTGRWHGARMPAHRGPIVFASTNVSRHCATRL